MSATYVTVTVRNPAEPHRTWEGNFRVEPGVINCLAPRKHLESIGLAAKGQRNYRWADGSETLMDFTTAAVELWTILPGPPFLWRRMMLSRCWVGRRWNR